MNYEEMEQWQLDQLIHNHVVCGGEWAIFFSGKGCEWVNVKTDQSISFAKFEAIDGVKRYEKPENAWPIIELAWDYLMAEDSHYHSHTVWDAYCIEHGVTKIRAAMICFLKMKDAEK